MKAQHPIQKMILAGLSHSEIIKKTGVAPSTVSFHAKKLGNPNKRDYTDQKLLAIKLINENHTNSEIRLQSQLSLSIICDLRKSLGKPSSQKFDVKCENKISQYDWSAIQTYHNSGFTVSECLRKFEISRKTWKVAKNKNLIKISSKKQKRTSVIWSITKEEFIEILSKCDTYTDVLRYFGLPSQGANWQTLKRRIQEENIDFVSKAFDKSYRNSFQKSSNIDDHLTQNSTIQSFHLKKKLFAAGYLERKCDECGIEETWNGKKLTLQLDHKNGINTDNRLENLRILCPNCHSQTETFAGKNARTKAPKEPKEKRIREVSKPTPISTYIRIEEKIENPCKICATLSYNPTYCSQACTHKGREKTSLTPEQLLEKLQANGMNYLRTGRELGVSDNAVRKRLRKAGLI